MRNQRKNYFVVICLFRLDNLMCNVPEVAMCYHLNGVVQVIIYANI